jgi:hypothetical protein
MSSISMGIIVEMESGEGCHGHVLGKLGGCHSTGPAMVSCGLDKPRNK